MKARPPERLVRYCGADCSTCETHQRFLAGDEGGVVNSETAYRCCWLPEEYPEGKDCPIKLCCEGRGIPSCGMCDELETCARMVAFYSQPGYDELKRRVLEVAGRVNE